MPTITIDGKDYEVSKGRNVLQAALDHKLNLPYFCWHPAMGSVGACRLCAIKHYRDKTDEHGRIAMGCMTPATDGTRVAIDEPEAAQFRRSVIEWLMINHPHDCPVCDEGGECHLQDMTVMTGHAYRRYRGSKRTYRNQYLGPLIHHEMNRCIQCYRCTRFYRDHAGGDDLGAFASRNRVYFGRVEDGVLESPFSGNLVEVCPTGVFTDKTLRRHYTRKWDLQSAPSICTHCSLGCNTIMGARYGSVRRVMSRYNGEVNGYWLCDRGRFGYEHLDADERLLHAQAPRREVGDPTTDAGGIWSEATVAVSQAAEAGRLAAIGSPRASLESNFALRALAGPDRFCCGLADVERQLVVRYARAAGSGAFHVPSLQQVQQADVVVVLGADLTHEAPLLDLALYRARAKGAAIHVIGLEPGRVGAFAGNGNGTADMIRYDSTAAARRARAVAAALRRGAGSDEPSDAHDAAIAQALAASPRPLVITGTQHRDADLLDAALDLVDAIDRAATATPWFSLAPAEANALGVALMDDDRGPTVEALVEAIETDRVGALVVGENDLFSRYPDQRRLQTALAGLDTLVLFDHMVTPTAGVATHVLPAAPAAESSGTLVNNEGRMQRFFQVQRPVEGVRPTWSLARDLMADTDGAAGWRHFEQVTAALERELPVFTGATKVAPPAGFRHAYQPVPRMSHRYSGRNATIRRDALDGLAAVGPHGELPVVRRESEDPDTPLAFTMEGFHGDPPAPLLPRVWAPGWSSNEAINQFQIEVGGPMHGGDPGRRVFDDHADDGADPAVTGAATTESISPVAPHSGFGDAADDQQPPQPSTPAGDVGVDRGVGDRVLVYATAEIFGSEPMSRRARGLAELIPGTYLRLHPERAAALGVAHGEVRKLTLSGDGVEAQLEAVIEVDPALPAHVATIPAGYPATRWWQRPVRLVIEAGEEVP